MPGCALTCWLRVHVLLLRLVQGKWHLGFWDWPYVPANRGFDSAFGYMTGAEDYWLHTNGKSCKGLDLHAGTPGTGPPSRRRDCHSAAPPSPFSRSANRDE